MIDEVCAILECQNSSFDCLPSFQIGLLREGEIIRVPFAYELYKASAKKRQSKDTRNMIESFKRIFSQPEVKVHFLGAW